MKTKNIVICAVFTALICVLAVITIPIGPVPITLGVLGIFLTSVILGPKKGTVSVLVYLLIGAIGLPVFSGFKGGFAVLAGPTGGYAWSYILMAVIVGAITKKLPQKKELAAIKIFAACLISVIVLYSAGTVQFMAVEQTGLKEALILCVIPFIPFEIVKAIIASTAGLSVRNALTKAGFI